MRFYHQGVQRCEKKMNCLRCPFSSPPHTQNNTIKYDSIKSQFIWFYINVTLRAHSEGSTTPFDPGHFAPRTVNSGPRAYNYISRGENRASESELYIILTQHTHTCATDARMFDYLLYDAFYWSALNNFSSFSLRAPSSLGPSARSFSWRRRLSRECAFLSANQIK